MNTVSDPRLDFPATQRNQDAIQAVLADHMGGVGRVLEIASGSGQHVAHLGVHFPDVIWQPSDPDPLHRQSIAAWTADLPNVLAPLDLDTTVPGRWIDDPVDMIICINMIHISPWQACLGVTAGCARALRDGGQLYLYGPFMENGGHNSDSNAQFDASL